MRESFHQFNPSIFLADNIKGIVGDSLTLEDAYYIGKVLGTMTKYLKGERALIGYDSRNSSTVLENELARGLIVTGMKVMSIGTCPSALLWFLNYELNPDLVVMITGSHYNVPYNGFRILMHGKPIYGEEFRHIRKIALSGNWQLSNGGTYISGNADPAYTKKLLSKTILNKESPLKVIWYGAFGTASKLLPQIIPSLAGTHIVIPDNGGDKEMMIQYLQKYITDQQADLGIAIDAQSDRLMLVDNLGRSIDYDRLLPILANYLSDGNLQGKKILTDYLTSEVMIDYLKRPWRGLRA